MKVLVMKRAAALGIFALGLTGLCAVAGATVTACAPTYGETEPDGPGSSTKDTKSEKLPTDLADGEKTKPPTSGNTGAGITSTGDGGSAPPKTPGSGDGGLDPDAASMLDGGACSKTPSASGYVIKEPTPQAIGACSTADIGYYEGLLAVKDQTFGGLKKALEERSKLCAGCVFSKYEDATWTPIVMLSADSGFYNWGSCYANTPGGTPACALQAQQWFSCLDDACGDCVSDDEYNTCVDKASVDPKQCGSLKFDKCGSNLDSLNAACDSIAKSIAAACGP